MFDWGFFFYTVIYGALVGRISIWIYHLQNEYHDKKFMKYLRIQYPDSVITLSSVSTSDAQALNKIKEQLHEHQRRQGSD